MLTYTIAFNSSISFFHYMSNNIKGLGICNSTLTMLTYGPEFQKSVSCIIILRIIDAILNTARGLCSVTI